MSFKKGDLLICVDNTFENPYYLGILPVIGQYYTWRGDHPTKKDLGYVEEIISPICPITLSECGHDKDWYEKVDSNVNIEQLVKESQLETV